MTDDLTAARMCRVYAAAGTLVVWNAPQLYRYADLLEKHSAECQSILDRAVAARQQAGRFWIGCAVMNVCAAVVLAVVI